MPLLMIESGLRSMAFSHSAVVQCSVLRMGHVEAGDAVSDDLLRRISLERVLHSRYNSSRDHGHLFPAP